MVVHVGARRAACERAAEVLERHVVAPAPMRDHTQEKFSGR
jgi:hypothetical protein